MKAALWAIGHIGTSTFGLPLLLEQGVFQDVVAICETSTTLSIKGTAFYILGLFSKTSEGAAALKKLGWEVTLDKFNESRGIAFPLDLDRFLYLPPTEYRGSLPLEQLRGELPKDDDYADDPIAKDIFMSVGNLSNHIVANSASKQLTKLRTEVPHYFARSELYHDVLEILYSYRYKLNAHRFIHELFDRVLLNEEALKHWNTPGRKFTKAIIADLQKLNKPDLLTILGLSQSPLTLVGKDPSTAATAPTAQSQAQGQQKKKEAQTLDAKKLVVGFKVQGK